MERPELKRYAVIFKPDLSTKIMVMGTSKKHASSLIFEKFNKQDLTEFIKDYSWIKGGESAANVKGGGD